MNFQQTVIKIMQVSRKVTRCVAEQSRLYRANPRRVLWREKELFTKSFIYHRQIDSLSDQSVRPARKPLGLPPTPFRLFLFFGWVSSLASRTHPPRFFLPSARFLGGINNFYRPSGRRNGKRRWAFNLLRV